MSTSGEQRYERVNDQWPAQFPPLTGPEAITAAKRLWRKATKKKLPWQIVITSGNRETWTTRRGVNRFIAKTVLAVNPEKGWRDLVHSISHLAHQKLHPDRDPHAAIHLWLEQELAAYVIARGWLDGKLKRTPKAKPPVQATRYQAVLARIETWERKRRRAASALKKLYRQKAYYDRQRAKAAPRAARAGACASKVRAAPSGALALP